MPDTNHEIAGLFEQMSQIIDVLGGNRFRSAAFARAARVLESLPDDVADLSDRDLLALDGIGKGTVTLIREYLEGGRVEEAEALFAEVPDGVVKLLSVPGLGPKTVHTLWQQGGVTDPKTLLAKLKTGELEALPRLGKKKLEQIAANLAFIDAASKRARIGAAMPLAQWFVEQLRQVKGVKEAAYAGSLRRGRETIGDLDILVAAPATHAAAIGEAFRGLEVVESVIAAGETKSSVRTTAATGGLQVDLRVVAPDHYGAALLYFTGSKEHNIRLRERAQARGLTLNEYALAVDDLDKYAGSPGTPVPGLQPGDPVASKTEEDIYAALGLQHIPPALREDHGEVALAERGNIPALVAMEDIAAELHTHTTASDGRWTIRELAAAAADRGFHTLAVTDHSKSQVQANGLDAARLEAHIAAVRAVADEMAGAIRVLAGSEVDILSDGKLDYPNSLLKELDIVVASPHAALTQDRAISTKRLLKAIANPYVTILGHPTGRIVNRRAGLPIDVPEIVKAVADRGIAVEINANHRRLDLKDTHARAALEAGCKLAINTDAHGPADLDELRYGVLTARRAGATKADVVNCLSKTKLDTWIAGTRG